MSDFFFEFYGFPKIQKYLFMFVVRPLIGDLRGRGKKLGGGLLGKNRDNLG